MPSGMLPLTIRFGQATRGIMATVLFTAGRQLQNRGKTQVLLESHFGKAMQANAVPLPRHLRKRKVNGLYIAARASGISSRGAEVGGGLTKGRAEGEG